MHEDKFETAHGELILNETEDGRTRVECRFADDTLWLSQAPMAELFQTTPQNITQHLKSLYEEGEIAEAATCKEYLRVLGSNKGRSLDGAALVHRGTGNW